MACKGICHKYQAKCGQDKSRYGNGQKRCQTCEIYIKWEGLRCPCCSYKLRTKPKNRIYKERLREAEK